MVATDQSRPPSSMNFLKEGLLIPTRNRGLFSSVLALNVVCAIVVVVPYALVISPLGSGISDDIKELRGTVPGTYLHGRLVKELKDDAREFLLAVAAYVLLAITLVSSAVSVVSVHAAVSSCSGETERPRTPSALLAAARGNLSGPFLTAVLSSVVSLACAGAVVALALLVVLVAQRVLALLFLGQILVVLAGVFVVYLSTVVCSVSVVVSVAEPECSGVGALSRAWRLCATKNRQAVLFMVVNWVATTAISPFYKHAMKYEDKSLAYGGFLGFVYVLLLGAMGVVSACAVTAYYNECKLQSKEEELAGGYAVAQTNEGNA